MPPLEEMDLNQTAVLWPAESVGAHGETVVSVDDREEIDVRWVEDRREVLDPHGRTVAIDVTAVVDKEIEPGGIMWLGCVNDIPGTSEVPEEGLHQVVTYRETPDLKGRNIRREITLMRYNDELPTAGT